MTPSLVCTSCMDAGVVPVTRSRWVGGSIDGCRAVVTGAVRCDACGGRPVDEPPDPETTDTDTDKAHENRCPVCGERYVAAHGRSWEKTCASTWPTYPVLHGHTDADSAIVADDYPYGFRARTRIRYWIESTSRGQRFCAQTLNPKTGRWNKSKKSTYADVMVMVRDDEGRVASTGLHTWATECELRRMERMLGAHSTDAQRAAIHHHRLLNRAARHITVDVGPAAPGGARQTTEEQRAVWERAIAYELRHDEQDEPA